MCFPCSLVIVNGEGKGGYIDTTKVEFINNIYIFIQIAVIAEYVVNLHLTIAATSSVQTEDGPHGLGK